MTLSETEAGSHWLTKGEAIDLAAWRSAMNGGEGVAVFEDATHEPPVYSVRSAESEKAKHETLVFEIRKANAKLVEAWLRRVRLLAQRANRSRAPKYEASPRGRMAV